MTDSFAAIRDDLGLVDIYLLDQILRGRVTDDMRILDAGSGSGRNIGPFVARGFAVYAVDADATALSRTVQLVKRHDRWYPDDRFHVAGADDLPFDSDAFDLVVCNAVLHFARDAGHFAAMVNELWRVLAPEGVLFTRLATTAGIEAQVVARDHGWFTLPDGSDRFLVSVDHLQAETNRLGARLLDPLKTTLVHGARSMTTWVLKKETS